MKAVPLGMTVLDGAGCARVYVCMPALAEHPLWVAVAERWWLHSTAGDAVACKCIHHIGTRICLARLDVN